MKSFKGYSFSSVCSMMILLFVFSAFTFQNTINWNEMNRKDAAKELVELNKKMSKIENYSYKVTYKSYEGHFKTVPHETVNGYIMRFGINTISNLGKIYTIQNKKLRVIIDSNTYSIKVTDPMKSNEYDADIEGYTKALEICEKIKKYQSGTTVGYRIENKAKKGVTAHEIHLDNGKLKESVLYYANEITTRVNNDYKTETVYPRLEMLYTDFTELKKTDEGLFSTNSIIEEVKGKLILKDKYKKFKLTDGRFN